MTFDDWEFAASMTFSVLGGGLQGCCIALALAERGKKVVLFERSSAILKRTAIANEGKIHLGWMYAADPSLTTAARMIEGALAFAPFMERYLGRATASWQTSQPAAYVVHRDSQQSTDAVRAYFASVHSMIGEASRARRNAYFGRDLSAEPREWRDRETHKQFEATQILAVFDSPEVAIDPIELAQAVGHAVNHHPNIEVRAQHEVTHVREAASGLIVTTIVEGSERAERFDHVVNALWESRIAIDTTLGIQHRRPWLYRLKYGMGFKWPVELTRPRSATFISGPFGEVVSYPDATTYLTWYPSCVVAMSREIKPPYWPANPPEPQRSAIVEATIRALARIVPTLAPLQELDLPDLWVKGGPIFAWGETDIDDPLSELHNRYDIGVHARGHYYSVDPGKLTMAPYFAERCVQMILENR